MKLPAKVFNAAAVMLLFGAFSACELRDNVRQKVNDATADVRQKATEVKDEFNDAKDKTEQKIDDIDTAVKAVNKVLGDDKKNEAKDK